MIAVPVKMPSRCSHRVAPVREQKKESAEQRRAREAMEALAAAEEEAARRAKAAAALRGRVAREAELSAINSRRVNAEWLQRMRVAKLEELHAEAGALSRAHDAQMDRHDRLIEVGGSKKRGDVCCGLVGQAGWCRWWR